MKKNKKGQDYDEFYFTAGWGFVEVPYSYTKERRPIPEDLANKRKAHMQALRADGNPYSWIAKLYEMSRVQVYKIVNDLPNN